MLRNNNVIKEGLEKLEVQKAYKELKNLVDNMNIWLDKITKDRVVDKVKDDYERLKEQTEKILNKINELKKKIANESNTKQAKVQNLLDKQTKSINKKKNQYKLELGNLYKELKKVAENMSSWIEKTKKVGIINKLKVEYKIAKISVEELAKKVIEFKVDLIDDKYIKILLNGEEIYVIFEKESSCLVLGKDKYKLSKIKIGKDIQDDSIKILNFSVKKEKPILSIIVPSKVAKKYGLSKNHSKPFILEGVIKREKIAEVAKWVVLYGKGELKLRIDNLDVIVEIKKV